MHKKSWIKLYRFFFSVPTLILFVFSIQGAQWVDTNGNVVTDSQAIAFSNIILYFIFFFPLNLFIRLGEHIYLNEPFGLMLEKPLFHLFDKNIIVSSKKKSTILILSRLLKFFNLDNWENGKYIGNIVPVLSEEEELLLSIKDYWSNCTYTYGTPPTKTTTFLEKQEFAKADILSCFTSAKNPDNFSEIRLLELGITNWNRYFYDLLLKDYIRKANALEILNKYTIAELKTMADSLGIKKTGKKAILAQNIFSHLIPDDIKRIEESAHLYILSKKGQHYVDSQEDYVLLGKYRNFNISLAEFNRHRMPDGIHRRNFYDTMFQVLCDRIFYYDCTKQYGALSIEHLHAFEIMMDEFENTEHNVPLDAALTHYIQYLYLQSCFPTQAHTYAVIPDSCHSPHASMPTISKRVYGLRDYKKFIDIGFCCTTYPPSFLTLDEFREYIDDIFDSSMFDPQKWNEKLLNRIILYSELINDN